MNAEHAESSMSMKKTLLSFPLISITIVHQWWELVWFACNLSRETNRKWFHCNEWLIPTSSFTSQTDSRSVGSKNMSIFFVVVFFPVDGVENISKTSSVGSVFIDRRSFFRVSLLLNNWSIAWFSSSSRIAALRFFFKLDDESDGTGKSNTSSDCCWLTRRRLFDVWLSKISSNSSCLFLLLRRAFDDANSSSIFCWLINQIVCEIKKLQLKFVRRLGKMWICASLAPSMCMIMFR